MSVNSSNVAEQFRVILLGSDINVYGMARSFHEAYGTISEAHGTRHLSPTKYSKIVTVHAHEDFDQPEGFIKVMRQLKAEISSDDKRKVLLVPCGDGYSELLARFKNELSETFICPTIPEEMQQQLANKVTFYAICEKYELPYPNTYIITKQLVEENNVSLPFAFPVALKPANSVEWLEIEFEGRKKAFIIHDQVEFDTIINKTYQAGYSSEMICQDFIPGDDSRMRVLNAYVDQNHQVRMMCLGHPLLEDPTPEAVGNYVAIMPDYNMDVYQNIKKFLETIQYTGFANFDMKYDERDGQYKLFEINIRQGRSSFYVTLGGYNLATYLVEDYVLETPFTETVFGKGNKLWLGVPKGIVKNYVVEGEDKDKAMSYIKANNYGTTLMYSKDMSVKRYALVKRIFYLYNARFKEFFRKK